MLNILMSHIVLNNASILSLVGQIEPTCMPEHMGMNRVVDLRLLTCACDNLPD